jgi:chromosome segregation ATPase
MSPLKQPLSVATAAVRVFFGLCLVLLGERSAGALPAVDLGSPDTDSRLQSVAETSDAGTVSPEVRDLQEAASGLEETLVGTLEKLKQLMGASEAAAMKLHDQLQAASRENEGLATKLADTWQKLSTLESDKREAQDRVAKLTNAAEQSRADIAGLSQELALNQQENERSERARSETATRLAETQQELDGVRNEIVQLRQELASTRLELEVSKTALAKAQDANNQVRSELDSIRTQILELINSTDAQVRSENALTIERPETREPGRTSLRTVRTAQPE